MDISPLLWISKYVKSDGRNNKPLPGDLSYGGRLRRHGPCGITSSPVTGPNVSQSLPGSLMRLEIGEKSKLDENNAPAFLPELAQAGPQHCLALLRNLLGNGLIYSLNIDYTLSLPGTVLGAEERVINKINIISVFMGLKSNEGNIPDQ